PLEVFLMLLLYRRIIPILKKNRLIPAETEITVRKRDYPICILASVIGIAVLVGYYLSTQ
ncbi:MAG: hypothetical protein ACI3XM_11160, partial [Eubacteriales bacterium]